MLNSLRYGHFTSIRSMIRGEIKIKDDVTLQKLKSCLTTFFPDDRFFPEPIELLSTDDEELPASRPVQEIKTEPFRFAMPQSSLPPPLEELLPPEELALSPENTQYKTLVPEPAQLSQPLINPVTAPKPINKLKALSRPVKPQPSIATYKTKTTMLRPAASYAKPSDCKKQKVQITVPYKTRIDPKARYDPKAEAFKLKGIREKIYSKTYLTTLDNDQAQKKVKEKEPARSDSENVLLNGNAEKDNSITVRKQTLRKRTKSMCSKKATSTYETSEEEEFQVPTKGLGATSRPVKNSKDDSIALGVENSNKRMYNKHETSEQETSEEEDFSQVPIQKSQSIRVRRRRQSVCV